MLAEAGYHGLTMEGVAARAGVGKATVYRWWRSKGALAGEALAHYLDIDAIPDTGNSRTDLLEVVRTTIHNYSATVAGTVIPALAADLINDPELKRVFLGQFLHPRRAVAASTLRRVIERGDLPEDLDVDLVMDMWAGTVFYRVLISENPVDDRMADQLVDLVLGAPPRIPSRPGRG